jgi:hypothetical protein
MPPVTHQAILMCRLLGVPFELRAPAGLIGADAETKQAPFLRLNPLGQARVLPLARRSHVACGPFPGAVRSVAVRIAGLEREQRAPHQAMMLA